MNEFTNIDKCIANEFLKFLKTHLQINNYTLENVVLGKIAPNSPIPFDNYIKELQIQDLAPHLFKDNLKSSIIDKNGNIANEAKDYFYQQFYIDQVNMIFHTAPTNSKKFRADGLFDFKSDLCDYLSNLFSLFKEILETPVTYTPFDLITPQTAQLDHMKFWVKAQYVMTAVKVKKLHNGSCINRYVANLSYCTDYFNRLIKKEKQDFYIINTNCESLDYKLALLSLFFFETPENQKLFELKMKKWEKAHNEKPFSQSREGL